MTLPHSTIHPPELTVAAVIERDGRFLMVEELVANRRVINQPAGHVEAGEDLRTAVIREALEETAWIFEPESVIGVYHWQAPADGPRFLRVAFAGRCHGHDADRPLDSGILAALWLTPDELHARAAQLRSPMVMRCIEDFRRGRRLDLADRSRPDLGALQGLALTL